MRDETVTGYMLVWALCLSFCSMFFDGAYSLTGGILATAGLLLWTAASLKNVLFDYWAQ